MSTLALLGILLIRLILPFTVLVTLGEWIHRREAKYWFHR